MSLVASTTTALTIIDGASLKRHATSYDSRRTLAIAAPRAHAWSTDNSTLYLNSSDAIYSFKPVSSAFAMLYSSPPGPPLQSVLVSRDKSTIIFAQGPAIHLLAVMSSPPKITSSLIGHSTPVTSLSLCNDASLLASSSTSGTLCVHNLAHNSLTVLKGLPSNSGASTKNLVCAFHPHTRTRLLVGCGRTLFIYDITRPSAPIKSIPLSDKDSTGAIPNIGQVVAISCSPFSKTLTAIAFNSGFIALVDLEKDRPFFKNLHLKVPVTSMVFTADGSSIAAGTENGKVIVQDLRSAEHDHRILLVGDEGKGERIIGLSVQRRIKNTPSNSSTVVIKSIANTAKLPASASVPLAQCDLNKAAAGLNSPTRRVVSTSPITESRASFVTSLKGRATRDEPLKRAFSPPKVVVLGDNGRDISVQIDTLMGSGGNPVARKKDSTSEANRGKHGVSKPRLSGSRMTPSSVTSAASVANRSRLSATAPVRASSSLSVVSRSGSATNPLARAVSPVGTRPTASSSSPKTLVEPSVALRTPIVSGPGITTPPDPPPQTEPAQATHAEPNRRASSTSKSHLARTPTPELPSIDDEEPQMWRTKLTDAGVLNNAGGILATPEMECWVKAGQGKYHSASHKAVNVGGKHVGWADSDWDSSVLEGGEILSDGGDDKPTIPAAAHETLESARPQSFVPESTSISPIHRPYIPPGVLQLSPLRSSPLRNAAGGVNSNGGAQELLRAVVNDIMYEYRKETKEDIKGLHLDLLRMGRSWKNGLHSLMDEYIGDLRELREENTKLRKENERLRRGF